MMSAYYSSDFIRQQMNWAFTLPPAVQSDLEGRARDLFGLTPVGITRIGAAMTAPTPA